MGEVGIFIEGTVRAFLLILHRLIVEQNLHLKLNVYALIKVTCHIKWHMMKLFPLTLKGQ